MTRRYFAGAIAAAQPVLLRGASKSLVDDTLRAGKKRRGIPCVTAAVASGKHILYRGAIGTRDAGSRTPVQPDAIFAIASMTKAVTSVAALQLVEQGKVSLEEPAEKYLPELRGRQVLDGYAADGRARLRPPSTPVTLRHLLTHTSGLCYSLWEAEVLKWQASPGAGSSATPPLMFDPGTRWQYGQGIDLAGRLVEAISRVSLEAYFQKHILGPLGMHDTSFILPRAKFARLVTGYRRQPDGVWTPNERKPPNPPQSFNGGGGLYSTAPDFARFMQAILKGGGGLLRPETFKLLTTNQIGDIRAGVLQSTSPAVSADVDIQPGETNHHTLGFVINPVAHQNGRAAGSLAWAGINNTFFWIDPKSDRCGVIMMQFLPFVDAEAIGLLNEFEQAVYQQFSYRRTY